MEQNSSRDIFKDLISLSQNANDIIEKEAKPSKAYSLWCDAFVELAKNVFEDQTPQESETETIEQFINRIPKLTNFFSDEVDHIKNVNLKNAKLNEKNRVHISKCNKKENLLNEKTSVNSTLPQDPIRKSLRLNAQNSLQENLKQSSLQNSKDSQDNLANNFQNSDKNHTNSVLVFDTPPIIPPRKNSSLSNKENNSVDHVIENQLQVHDKNSNDKKISDENIITDKEIEETPNSVISTTRELRSCKRKSSLASKNANKKQKTYSQTSTSSGSLASMNDALVKGNASNKKLKNSAISLHTPNVLPSPAYLKKSIIQESEKIDKKVKKLNEKQVKANENLKKIGHLRQQKLEESKRKREEKMERVLRTKKQIDKATEDRLKNSVQNKAENVVKNKIGKTTGKRKKPQTDGSEDEKSLKENNTISTYQKIKNKIMKMPLKTDTKTDDSVVASKPSGKIKSKRQDSGKENNSNADNFQENKHLQVPNKIVKSQAESNQTNLNSTYVASTEPVMMNAASNTKKTSSESYDMTPQRESYTNYDISEIKSDEEEEDVPSSKPFPKWATGILLKNAMIATYYNQDQMDALFSDDIPPINLEEIFGVKKKKYFHRTSSAVWRKSEAFQTCK